MKASFFSICSISLLFPVIMQGVTVEELKARAQEAEKKRSQGEIQYKMKERLKNSSTYNKSSSMGDKIKNRAYYTAKMKAASGDANAQFALAGMYYQGIMIKKDYSEAIKWYEQSARRGHKKAQFNLGYIYFDGRGVPKDHDEALKWFLEAGKHEAGGRGDGKADLYIGLIYDERGDDKNAFFWYLDAAKQGYPVAQYKVAMKYREGKGCRKDIKKMIFYLKEAAVQSEAQSQYQLGLAYINGTGVSKDLASAKQWMQSSYANGENRAKEILEKYKWEIPNK